jgi:hypothetical protein
LYRINFNHTSWIKFMLSRISWRNVIVVHIINISIKLIISIKCICYHLTFIVNSRIGFFYSTSLINRFLFSKLTIKSCIILWFKVLYSLLNILLNSILLCNDLLLISSNSLIFFRNYTIIYSNYSTIRLIINFFILL